MVRDINGLGLKWNQGKFKFGPNFKCIVSDSDPISTWNWLDGFDYRKQVC